MSRIAGKTRLILLIGCLLLAVGVLLHDDGREKPFLAFGEGRRLPIYCVDTKEKKVAISFDAAWGNEQTRGILDILDRYEVKATFFLVDFWAEKYPDDVAEIWNRGHDIGNHSSTHPDMAHLSAEQIRTELSEAAKRIQEITGHQTVLFRPPFGSYSNNLIQTCESMGYHVIQWDVDSLDWKQISPELIVERVTRNVGPGSIVLFHNNAEHVLEYLPPVIEKLQADGYQFVLIRDLIYTDDYHMDHAGKQVKGL